MDVKSISKGSLDPVPANEECETCGKCFTSKYSMTRHKMIIHSGINQMEEDELHTMKFKCETCEKLFFTPDEFPWQVSLKSFGSHICGGSVVNRNQVII